MSPKLIWHWTSFHYLDDIRCTFRLVAFCWACQVFASYMEFEPGSKRNKLELRDMQGQIVRRLRLVSWVVEKHWLQAWLEAWPEAKWVARKVEVEVWKFGQPWEEVWT